MKRRCTGGKWENPRTRADWRIPSGETWFLRCAPADEPKSGLVAGVGLTDDKDARLISYVFVGQLCPVQGAVSRLTPGSDAVAR